MAAAPAPTDISAAFTQALQQFAASSGASGASAAQADPQLYLGPGSVRNGTTIKLGVRDGENITGPNLQRGPKISTLSEAQQMWYSWDQADRLKWTKRAFSLGYLTSPLDVQGAQQLWMNSVNESVKYFGAGKQVSPWDVLDINAGSNADALKKRGQVNKDGSITSTNSSINLSDRASVEALSSQVLQQALGRDPTQAEINTYYNTIRGQEKAHPTVTTSTTSASGQTSSTTSGGFTQTDAAQMLQDRLKNDPEHAKYQAGTTYFQAAMGALGAIGGA